VDIAAPAAQRIELGKAGIVAGDRQSWRVLEAESKGKPRHEMNNAAGLPALRFGEPDWTGQKSLDDFLFAATFAAASAAIVVEALRRLR